jgi:hypothetical protein
MKNFNIRFLILLSVLSFSGLSLLAQKKKVVKKTIPAKTVATENSLIKNGIKITSKGFTVSEAYLVLDDESLVPANNKVNINENVNMVLIIDKGWTESEGRVFPGSKQIVKLSTGTELLNSDDLFAAFDETGVSPEDARYITLNAVITEMKNKANHVIVNFNLWDKKGAATLSGSYKLYIK